MAPGKIRSENNGVALKHILDGEFRASPGYDLVLFDRLPPDQKEALADLKNDPDFYGVLLPKEGNARGIKSVCKDTALLYLTLNQAGALPAYLHTALGERCNQAVAELVLDGVLEMAREGRFVCGAEAYDSIYLGSEPSQPAEETCGKLARLAREALRYGQAMDLEDSGRLSARLYFYNRIPLSARWARRLPSEDDAANYLGIDRHRARIERRWTRQKIAEPFNGWFLWQLRDMHAADKQSGHGYKLYVSPQPDHARDAFEAVLEIAGDSGAHHFKIGNDAAGLLRPDKLVVYFWSLDALQETAKRILERLRDCPAHGVPFTAEITSDGLLSWGFDPPPDKGALAWRERESWRLWITNRLATALLAAKKNGSGDIEPWQFALERLRLENIDTNTWAPTDAFGRATGE